MLYMTGTATLLFSACTSNNTLPYLGGYVYSGITFGKNLSDYYKQGIRDGCRTAQGFYTKSHTLFKTADDYYDGWFLGRNRCRHLLVIEE